MNAINECMRMNKCKEWLLSPCYHVERGILSEPSGRVPGNN